MKKEFKDLPLESPESIIDAVYDGKSSNIEELEKILNKPFNVDEYLDGLNKEDELTDKLYEKTEDGKLKFQPKDNKYTGSIVVGGIGEQRNIYHKESILDNAKITSLRLMGKSIEGESQLEMGLMGLLSQEGRKYTRFSKEGKIDFDEHEKLSAYLAARRYKSIGIDKEKAKPFIVAIYHQNVQKGDWNKTVEEKRTILSFKKKEKKTYEKEFVEKYGERARTLTKELAEANNGITTERDLKEARSVLSKAKGILNSTLIDYIDRAGIPPEANSKIQQVEQNKLLQRAEKNINENNKNIQKEADERLRLERERIRRERERQEWIQYEKEKEIFDRQLIRGAFAVATIGVVAPTIHEVFNKNKKLQINERGLNKLINNKSDKREAHKKEKEIKNKEKIGKTRKRKNEDKEFENTLERNKF